LRRLKTLILENFQSHAHTELEIADTLTVIVGETDQGKTAVVRALSWLFLNEPRGADFIRAGETECTVTAVFDDGVRLSRKRSSSKNRYIIEYPGQEPLILEGFGTSVPKEVIDLTGIARLPIDDSVSLALHFSRQLDPPFLLNETGAVKARAIGQLTGTHLFDLAHKRTARDVSRLEETKKELEEEIGKKEEELKSFADLPQLEKTITKTEKIYHRLEEINSLKAELEKLNASFKQNRLLLREVTKTLEKLEPLSAAENNYLRASYALEHYKEASLLKKKLESVRRELSGAEKIITFTEELPQAAKDTDKLEENSIRAKRLLDLKTRLDNIKENLISAEKTLNTTTEIGAAAEITDQTDRIYALIARLKVLQERLSEVNQNLYPAAEMVNRTEKLADAFDLAGKLEVIYPNAERLQALRERLLANSKELNRAEDTLQALSSVPQATNILSVLEHMPERHKALSNMAKSFKNCNLSLKKAKNAAAKAELELTSYTEEYAELLQKTGKCPVCYAPITPEAVERIVREEIKGGF